MKQFDITEWCDFVRGVVEPEKEAQMKKCLDSSTTDQRTFDLLQRVAEVGRADQALEIPEYAVRGAKAIGSLTRPKRGEAESHSILSSLWRRLPFDITYDSLLQPAPAGTRDSHSPHRQVHFEADHYTVDVRWEQDADPRHTVIIGQILRTTENLPAPEIPVYMVSEGEIVGRTQSNLFGEFQADRLPKRTMKLCLLVGEEELLELPLTGDRDVRDEKTV